MLKYVSRLQAEVNPEARAFWANGGWPLGSLLHPTHPQTLPQLTATFAQRHGPKAPPLTPLAPYLAHQLCGLIENGFVRVACPTHWPIAQRPNHPLTFQLNPALESVRRQHPTVWQTHGQTIGQLLKTISPLTLDELDDACRAYAQRDKSFPLRPGNKLALAHALLLLADYDLVQLVLPRHYRITPHPERPALYPNGRSSHRAPLKQNHHAK